MARDTANPDIDQAPSRCCYLLDDHRPTRRMQIVLRAAAPASLAPALRAAIRDVDADLPAYQLRTAAEGFADENSSNLLLGGLFAAFALVAMLLATTGLYGVMSYAVSQRTPEIAVRLALGAPARAIAASVIGRSVALAAIGAVAGPGRRPGAGPGDAVGAVRRHRHRSGHLPGRRGAGAGRGGRRRLAADATGGAGRSDSEFAPGLEAQTRDQRLAASG